MSFLQGVQQGVQFGQNRDLRQQQQNVLNQRQEQMAQEIDQKALSDFQGLLGDTVSYVKTLPLEQRAEAAKAYMGIRQADPEMVARLEQSGYLSPQFLSDQSLDGFMASMRDEQILKDKEVLIGRDGQPIYTNRYNAPQVVAQGSALVNDQGGALFRNEAAQDLPTGMRMGANGPEWIPEYIEGQERLKSAGRATTSVTVGGQQEPTPAQKAVDTAFAKEYLAWRQGGASDAVKQLGQLNEALGALESGKPLTGPMISLVPDALKAFNQTGQESIAARDAINEVVQRNLRVILGAQFTEKEGKMLMDRAFNDKLPPQENAKRVKRLIEQIRLAAESKQSAAQYYEEKNTIMGWQGNIPTMDDFNRLVDEMDKSAGVNANQASNKQGNFTQREDGVLVWGGN